jgi:hypothetical protein
MVVVDPKGVCGPDNKLPSNILHIIMEVLSINHDDYP